MTTMNEERAGFERASAAQSAPAGEREAFEAWWKLDAEGSENKAAAYEGWKARAAYAQGNPVNEREAFRSWHESIGYPAALMTCGDLMAFQAGAAWQRTQSAGVPDGEEVEVVAVVKHNSPLPGYTDFMKYEPWMDGGLSDGWEPLMTVAQHERIVAALSAQQPAHVSVLRGLVEEFVAHIKDITCTHDNTHRGGAIWEICDDCGDKWADDRGGKPAFKWPECVEKARAILNGGEA